jgi:hypothetical protein
MKTKILFIMFAAAIVVAGCKKNDPVADVYEDDNTPPYAASKKVWVFGNQTWSDAICCPEYNKETFTRSFTDPQCRSYTENGKTMYYYNWAYVNANKEKMCPTPWHVPWQSDLSTLVSCTNYATLGTQWGYGGSAFEDGIFRPAVNGLYWSSTAASDNKRSAFCLAYNPDEFCACDGDGYIGMQVRCVKDN